MRNTEGTENTVICNCKQVKLFDIEDALYRKDRFSDVEKEFEDVQVTTTVEESTKANDSSNTFMEETIIKCCYELRYIFAINEFDDISTVSVNKLAQYGL